MTPRRTEFFTDDSLTWLSDGMSVPVAEALAARGIPFVVATGYDAIPAAYNGAPLLRKLFTPDEVIEAIANPEAVVRVTARLQSCPHALRIPSGGTGTDGSSAA
jgi:hypothetical protein